MAIVIVIAYDVRSYWWIPSRCKQRKTPQMNNKIFVRAVAAIATSLVAAVISLKLSSVIPLIGPLLWALIIGIIVANSPEPISGRLRTTGGGVQMMLRLGVAMIGLKLSLYDLLALGLPGLIVIVATVTATYVGTLWLGRILRLESGLVQLIAGGFAICGAAAIVAINETVRANRRDVGLALALVTLFGSLMIILIPASSRALGLSNEQAAIWAGASIHEVAQVVAAASLIGTAALAPATTIKLGRVLMLAPVVAFAGRSRSDAQRSPSPLPWFVAAFLVAVVIATTGVLPPAVLRVTDLITVLLLAAGMFGLGTGIAVKDLWPIPKSALALSVGATFIATGVALLCVLTLV